MASPLEQEKDEMGSLFEGMVLFNPSQIPEDDEDDDHHDPSPPPASSTSSSSSVPLDENLFSDLTLVTPIDTLTLQPQSDPSPTPTAEEIPSVSVSRQVSRRKKRAGIRIGYGRDTSLPDDPSPISPLPATIESYYSQPPAAGIERKFSLPKQLSSSHLATSDANSLTVVAHCDNIDADPPRINEEDAGAGGSTFEEKLEQIRARISEELRRIGDMAASVSATRKESARRRRKAAQNLNLASLNYKRLEKQLEEACEAEDFERAESVSESLAAAEKEKQGFTNALRDAEADCDSVDLKMQEVLELQIVAEEEGVSLLQQFTKDAANNADLVLKNAEELSSKEMGEWLSSTEDSEVKKMELEIESYLINDARLALNDSIEHSIEDDKREKELLCKKQDLLTEELETLLALVRQKEAEIAENDSNIQEVEKRIADVVSEFHEVQSSVNLKYDNLQSVLSRMEVESEALSLKKNEVDDFLAQEEKRGAKLKELASFSADEAKARQELVGLRKSLALLILKSREDKVRLGKTEEKILEDVQILRRQVSTARASLRELSSTRSSIHQEIASSKQRILFIDKRGPELEAEKKVAAAARNFKEAGRIATEAKTLSFEKENIQIKMEAAILELEKIEEEIKDIVNTLQETEEQISSKEKKAAMAGCERLRLVAAAAMAERSAALELGDLEEANVLFAEAEAANSEATKLQQAYDFKEEEFGSIPKHLISMELITNLGGKQLAEMAASVSLSAA